jgi:hypothetical protein
MIAASGATARITHRLWPADRFARRVNGEILPLQGSAWAIIGGAAAEHAAEGMSPLRQSHGQTWSAGCFAWPCIRVGVMVE